MDIYDRLSLSLSLSLFCFYIISIAINITIATLTEKLVLDIDEMLGFEYTLHIGTIDRVLPCKMQSIARF